MSKVPDIILDLVERFDRHVEAYRRGQYGETRVRVEFIDPLFIALGWDVHNEQGYAEAYKDVIHEDAVKVGGATKAPDYCFRVGGTRKFFLEAKKPSVDIRGDIAPAYQLRRYAWSAKLPLSILTDFEELAVYDCRVRPKHADKPSVARVLYLTYREYADRWDDIAGIFSKDAVLQGSFDKYAGGRKKRGTAEVDTEFLKEIEAWREALAGNIALRNSALTVRELNFAVQRTIDRIIFLRMCEDRGVEDYGRLQALINGRDVYGRLMQLFRQADDRYNSGLFHFNREKGQATQPDDLTPGLKIDDKVLKDIFKSLYYPQSPYEFTVLPSDILGNVYEQFLGKVIHLTPGHRAKIEEKPEVRKAGGVYYTPKHIVDYIVEHTVGKLIADKTPLGISRLRILDPACGSGSFLVGAYRTLLDYHRDSYVKDGPEKHRKKVYQGAGEQWYLTTDEKKRILLNNIYGVDIDPQAVEVSKLNLLLCVLENENQQTLAPGGRLFHERALPDLGGNVKCGNSLIASDFYTGKQLALFDDETRYRVNAFDWQDEFPDIFKRKNPGFDAVIGNPPYVFGEYHDEKSKDYFKVNFRVAKDQYDTYWLFIEQGLNLTRQNGQFALIVPDALLARDICYRVRSALLENGLERIYHCGLVFRAAVSTVVFNVSKGTSPKELVSEVREGIKPVIEHACDPHRFMHASNNRLLVHASDEEARLLDKLTAGRMSLGQIAVLSRGEEIGKKNVLSAGPIPIIVGADISRYSIQPPSRFVNRRKKNAGIYKGPKIVIVKTGSTCVAALDESGVVTMQSVYNTHVQSDEIERAALLGVINSKLIRFLVDKTFTAYKLLFPQLNQSTVESIPITPLLQKRQDRLILTVEQILRLHRESSSARTQHDKTLLQREITATDREIDRLVYELYGLTDAEIAIVEESPT